MKIGILTYHFVNNFGGVLQAYALRQTLERKLNQQAFVIDYRHPFILFTDFVRLFPVSASLKTIFFGFLTLMQRFRRLSRFLKFQKRELNLTHCFITKRGFRKHVSDFDVYISGSDQIWNPKITLGLCPSYCLDFVSTDKRKIAYAPSFGTYGLKHAHFERVARLVSSYARLSVRETEGCELLGEILGRRVPRLIDPTFLLTPEEWGAVAVPGTRRKRYILLYIMQADETVYSYARRLKELLGCPLVEISRYGTRHSFVDETIVDAGPNEFLGLFRDAEFVCTNSFHGLCFSLIFTKRFYLVPSRRFSARLTSQLQIFGLEDLAGKKVDEIVSMEFPWKRIGEIVEEEREKAVRYLETGVGGGGE